MKTTKKKAFLPKKPFAERLSFSIILSTFVMVTILLIGMTVIFNITSMTQSTQIWLCIILECVLICLNYLFNTSIIRRHTNPIIELTYKANSIAKGNFKTKMPEVNTENEVKKLRDSFDYMQTSVNNIIEDVRATTANSERMESELNIASSIQLSMLPHDFPHTRKLDLCALLSPAKEVGGDLYDFYIKDSKLFFTIGDVSGKGVPAALYMAITRSSFRFSAGMDLKINEIVSRINNVFSTGNTTQMFVTMFAGVLDLDSRRLDFCNAGHNPIIIIDKEGKAQYLRSKTNIAIGVFEDYPYEMESITLDEDSRLLLYTDGVSEAERADKEMYGEDRLLDFANSITKGATSEDVMQGLRKSVSAFTCGNPQNDDITIMSFLLSNLSSI